MINRLVTRLLNFINLPNLHLYIGFLTKNFTSPF